MSVVQQAVSQARDRAQLPADVDACKRPPPVSKGGQALPSTDNCSQDLPQWHCIATATPPPDKVNVL